MRRMSSRNGSALLIVLGMLSFMIISAVGFAAYMRYSRLPSSYLRRSASSRQLAKAALAEAIDTVDRVVNNNPHPGVGDNQRGTERLHNYWMHQVFMGTNNESRVSDTVSPLCLEALAYLPPPLVNEARYWSRRAWSATWQPLGFDAGRYVWCAVDVSDCFDINRLQADAPRSSASNRRVSLAHIFENDTHTTPGTGAAAWDNFMKRFRGEPDEETFQFDLKGRNPFISMADFNLALGAQGSVAEYKSPFVEYLKSNGASGFYATRNDADEERIRNMAFVTDSLFPPVSPNAKTEEGLQIYDLTDAKNQPFTTAFLETERPALSDVMLRTSQSPSDSWMKWQDRLSGLGRAALYDYLDPDHVPVSLAIPTTERVPMICGMGPELVNGKFGVVKRYAKQAGGEEVDAPFPHGDQNPEAVADPNATRECRQSVYYRVTPDFARAFMGGEVRSLVCFPFNHSDPTDGTFTADGRLSLFLTSGEVSLRTGNATDAYGLKDKQITDEPLNAATGVISVKLPEQQVNFKGVTINEEKDAVKIVAFTLPSSAQTQIGTALQSAGNELLRIDYVWNQTYVVKMTGGVLAGKGEWLPKWENATAENGNLRVEKAHCGLPATAWQNRSYQGVDSDMANDNAVTAFIKNNGSKLLTLRAAVWLRMRDDKGKIVDMVPACFNDDKVQNGMNDPYPLMNVVAQSNLGAANPLMLFNTGVTFDFSIAGLDNLLTTPQDMVVEPKRVIVSDPRFNHAPEHWYKMNEELTEENWIRNNQIGSSGSGKDNDIFMATSDAGYLQSRYEIAFLPRFTNLNSGGDIVGSYESPDGTRLTAIPDTFAQTRNQHLIWKTYDPLNDNVDDFYDLPWRNEGTGQMVNPYSNSTNVLMAAFANTPIDWKRASTNVVNISGAEDFASMTASTFNKKYAFNEYSSEATLAWSDLQRIAGRFHAAVHTGTGKNWEDAWDDLDWTGRRGEEDRFMGFDMDSKSDLLWTADRKFLYGFWRDCFAAKQQLFLIFVRAEPMMMGGGSGSNGQVPPQFGARAMALVWRDPRKSRESTGKDGAPAPHQTRILFYRQFD